MKKPLRIKRSLLPWILLGFIPTLSFSKISTYNPLGKSWECKANDGQWVCLQTDNQSAKLFKKNIPIREKKQVIANALGWIPTLDPNNLSGGYYYQRPIIKAPSNKAKINAQQYQYARNGTITAEGAVEVVRGNQYLSAEEVTLKKTGNRKVNQITLTGNVNISQPGQLIIGSKAHAHLSDNTATLDNAYYLLRVREKPGETLDQFGDSTSAQSKNFTGFAHGHADKVTQQSKTNYTLKNVTYATDNPFRNDWMLGASTIKLDRKSGFATAYNAIFHVRGVPILYWPYITFPIDNRRRTGFLYPTSGYNSNAGYYLSIPFYWNLAPNYDFLLTSTIFNHRGVLFDGNFRYLTKHNQGNIVGEYLPHDRVNSMERKAFSFIDNGNYGQHWFSHINYQYIGDKAFYRDFNSANLGLSTQTLLDRQAKLGYNNEHWEVNTTVQAYDVIDDEILLANRPYWLLPQINANANYNNLIPHVNFEWQTQLSYFYKPDFKGQRYYTSPKISIPLQRSWGFVTPSLALSGTIYHLQNRGINTSSGFSQSTFRDRSVNRILPILNVDTGLYFDRQFNFNKNSYTQTLRPRVSYTYIPYQDQSNIPLFDTAYSNFTYSSLFQTNRFTGLDRINNANQIAYSLETSIKDETGLDIISAGIGQIFYFSNRKVSICSGASKKDCSNQFTPFHDKKLSSIASFANYRFLPGWQLKTQLVYNQHSNNVDYQSYQVQYLPNTAHIFNIGYQNIQNNYSALTPAQIQNNQKPVLLSQITFSSIWKVTPNWSVTGLWSYSLNSKHTNNIFGGVQYNAASWAIRLLAQRYANSANNPNNPTEVSGKLTNAYVVQFELKGLGSSSESSLNQRLSMIQGHKPGSGFN